MIRAVDDRFGTARGLARLALSWPQHWLGLFARPPADAAVVRRFVFVCRGNISRSAYAERVMRASGVEAASFGVSAIDDGPVDPVAARVAAARGVDLSPHRSCTIGAFAPRAGDLLLAMEVRQLAAVERDRRLVGLPHELLGRYARAPHLHDPFTLGEDYYRRCFDRIDRACAALRTAYPNARTGR